ncbi:MAG: hypothetical protein AAF551_03335 [Bacteroidota bacterium]
MTSSPFFLCTFTFVFLSCDDHLETLSVDHAEVEAHVSSIINSDIANLTRDMDKLVKSAETYSRITNCSVPYDTVMSFERSRDLSLNVETSYLYGMNCDGPFPTGLFVDFSSMTDLESTETSMKGHSEGSLTITGLLANAYTVDGTFKSAMSHHQKRLATTPSLFTYTVTVFSLKITKDAGKVIGGTLELVREMHDTYQNDTEVSFNVDDTTTTTTYNRIPYTINIR